MKTYHNLWIETDGGVRLSADLYLPDDGERHPVIVSCYPYHKDCFLRQSLMPSIEMFTMHAYAYALVDCRGTGSSEGVSTDPLDCLNPRDLYNVIDWAATEKWSNGNVGMWGSSYGGMTALVSAATKHPSLKAAAPVMAPSYFYSLAYPGGLLNMIGLCGGWLAFMNVMNLIPPLDADDDERTRIWRMRMDSYIPYLITGLKHSRYDEYWRKYDIKLDQIETPLLIIDGWNTFSTQDAIMQYILAKGPKKMIIGPWTHFDPNISSKIPIDHLYEILRWFDHWLKSIDNGVMNEPPISVYIMGEEEWRYLGEWQVSPEEKAVYYLSPHGMLSGEAETGEVSYNCEYSVGVSSGMKIVFPMGIDYPRDQRCDMAHSLTFISRELEKDVEVIGAPDIILHLSTDMEDAGLSVKLIDIDPAGRAILVTSGLLRLSHREGHEKPMAPKKNEVTMINIEMWPTAYLFRKGHRVGLSVSCSDFPRVFPLVYRGKVTLHMSSIYKNLLKLPVGRVIKDKKPSFKLPDYSLILKYPMLMEPKWRIIRDNINDNTTVEMGVRIEYYPEYLDSEFLLENVYNASITKDDPSTATITANTYSRYTIKNRRYEIRSIQIMNQKELIISSKIDEDGREIFSKKFSLKHDINK